MITFKQFIAEAKEAKAKYTLDRFYDRSIRSWTILCKDENDYQVGEAVHVYSKLEALAITLEDFDFPKE